jgi:FAD binding domain
MRRHVRLAATAAGESTNWSKPSVTTVGEKDASIARPADQAFGISTQVFNLAAPVRPAAAVTVRTIGQIRAALRYAESEGLPVRVLSTGHSAATARPMAGALLIRTELGDAVDVDSHRRTARVAAGTRWGTVVAAAAQHGLAAPHGSSPDVGVVGYLLRGGVSFYGRRVGLAVNSVRAIELVTADGELRRADASSDPELFWALRGGGGGFGVVTAVEIDLFPAARVMTGAAFWPAAHAGRLLSLWRRWTADAPWDATTSLRVMNLPQVPAIPPALTAGPVLAVDGAVLAQSGDDVARAQQDAAGLLEPLRAVAEPLLDTWTLTTPEAVVHTHMDPAEPVAVFGDHMLLGEIGDEGAAEFLGIIGDRPGSPLVCTELRQLGGAFAAPPVAGGALDRLGARYAYLAAGVLIGTATQESITSRLAAARAVLTPWDTGKTAPTFVETLEQPQGILDRQAIRAVDRVRARVDPFGQFRDEIAPNASAAW